MFQKFMTKYFSQSEGSEAEKRTKYSTYIAFFFMSLIHLLVYKNLKFGFKKYMVQFLHLWKCIIFSFIVFAISFHLYGRNRILNSCFVIYNSLFNLSSLVC